MKRDMELVREILLKLELEPLDGNLWSIDPNGLGIEGYSYEEISYNLLQIIDAELINGAREQSGQFAIRNITWKGHEYLDDIRDPDIWRKTKARTKDFASVGFG